MKIQILIPKSEKMCDKSIHPSVIINKRAYVAQRDQNVTKMIANMVVE